MARALSRTVVNDPWGEPDRIHGTTFNANGMALRGAFSATFGAGGGSVAPPA